MELEEEYYSDDTADDNEAPLSPHMVTWELAELSDEESLDDFIATLNDWD